MHILLINVHLDCWWESSSNTNANRDESVLTRDEPVETRDEYVEAGENTTIMTIMLSLKLNHVNKRGPMNIRNCQALCSTHLFGFSRDYFNHWLPK